MAQSTPSTAINPNLSSLSTPAATMPLISPHTVLFSTLSRSPPIRPSGRSPSSSRPISLNTSSLSHADGSALVKIGQTSAVCDVRAEILPVHEIASYQINKADFTTSSSRTGDADSNQVLRTLNLLVPNMELATGCSPYHLPGSPPSIEAQTLTQRLLSFLHVSGVVRAGDLAIYASKADETGDLDRRLEAAKIAGDSEMSDVEGGPEAGAGSGNPTGPTKAYWVLYIDTLVINHDGNLFDTCALAILAALRDTKLPRAWWDEDAEGVLCDAEAPQRSLRLEGMPVPLSFAVFRSSKLEEQGSVENKVQEVLCDPDGFEEACCHENGCAIVDQTAEGEMSIVKLEKNGGGAVGVSEIGEIVEKASERWRLWQKVLQEVDEARKQKT